MPLGSVIQPFAASKLSAKRVWLPGAWMSSCSVMLVVAPSVSATVMVGVESPEVVGVPKRLPSFESCNPVGKPLAEKESWSPSESPASNHKEMD